MTTVLTDKKRLKPAVFRRPEVSLAGRAYLKIRDKILKGDLPAGMALSRRTLAEELKISVPPVAEALLHLEHDGLVESKPRVGTRVRIPTRWDIEDRCELREALETQAARLFVVRATSAEKAVLGRLGQEVDRLYAEAERRPEDRDFLFAVNTHHVRLHLQIAEGARCPVLLEAIERERVLVFSWLFDTVVQRRSLGSDFHVQLTRVLAVGTPEQAASAMREHIQRGLREVIAGLTGLTPGTPDRWRASKRTASGR
jgi:DNA-binding GntR family transcriptional regulator